MTQPSWPPDKSEYSFINIPFRTCLKLQKDHTKISTN